MTSALNATAGNAVNVVIFLATANPLGWAAGERPALVFTCNDDPYVSEIVKGQFMMVDAKPLEDLKNATVVIPMVERTVEYMQNMSSDSPESAKYCMLNVVQFGMDLYCLSDMGGGLINLNKGEVISQYKNVSGGTVRIVKINLLEPKFSGDYNLRPSRYTSVFEMQLDPSDFGKSRSVHFNRANAALDGAIRANSGLAELVEEIIPGVREAVSSIGGRENPSNWTWEHVPSNMAGGRMGVMRLVPTYQHTPGSLWWRVIHPNEGAVGGYSEWAIPAGAPSN